MSPKGTAVATVSPRSIRNVEYAERQRQAGSFADAIVPRLFPETMLFGTASVNLPVLMRDSTRPVQTPSTRLHPTCSYLGVWLTTESFQICARLVTVQNRPTAEIPTVLFLPVLNSLYLVLRRYVCSPYIPRQGARVLSSTCYNAI